MIQTNIRGLRKDKGLSLCELARQAEINKGQLSLIERAFYLPKIDQAERISKALGEKIRFWIEVEPRES